MELANKRLMITEDTHHRLRLYVVNNKLQTFNDGIRKLLKISSKEEKK